MHQGICTSRLTLQTEIQIDSNNNYYEVSTYSTTAGPSKPNGQAEKKALEKAEINLNDCLACRLASFGRKRETQLTNQWLHHLHRVDADHLAVA